ncbi:GGDEF domain-containing protein [Rhodoferax saidenbachensis]|uniref:diguanylate cyclase n=1 Tax=Rhodoferax saidenbachensis TaxID=1484693 RepID=A0ABU1ZL28_9BURK|nr:GGDEF domain-containing protein [Rhodoferax saidenbachensis]MDR7306249.1 diguanylate cyclase (GGDEF)-like protein [Rhodoferax saidenbachensis]
MEHLSVLTILVLTALNLSTVSIALPVIMGKDISRAAKLAQLSLLSQTIGWMAIISSGFFGGHWLDPALSTVSMAFGSLANCLMFFALCEWLGPRPYPRLLVGLAIAMPIGYVLVFGNYSWRVGYANLLFGMQLLIVARAALFPRGDASLRWRTLIALCYTAFAVANLARGVLGAFFPELYPSFDAPHVVNIVAQITANVALVLTTVAILVAWREEAEAQLREQAFTDNVTGLLNRHGWDDRATALFDQARRHGTPLALILLDLDHFKRINDTQGHEMGDQVLRMTGGVLEENRRSSDVAARIGGEEFALLLPQTDRSAALHVEQRLRLALREEGIQEPHMRVNYSAGLALLQPGDLKLADLMARADAALYQAKAQGRGRLLQAD